MSEKKTYETFRKMLQEGIGKRTQKEFAEACGISKDYLNRMLREHFIFRPSKATLRKLAVHMDNVTLAQLYEACDYNDEAAILTKKESALTETQKRLKLPDWKRCMLHVQDLQEGFHAFTATGQSLEPRFANLFEYVHMLYTAEDTVFKIRKMDTVGNLGRAVIEAKSETDYYQITVLFVIFIKTDKDGQELKIDHVSFSGADVLEAQGLQDSELADFAKYGIDLNAADTVIVMDVNPNSPEGRLRSALFGNTDESTAMDSLVVGFGFYLKEVPPRFWQFLAAHKDAFCQTEEETKLYQSAMEVQTDPKTCFQSYIGEKADYGYLGVIATIMRRETDLPFEAWEDRRGEYQDNPPCIICDEDYNVSNEQLEDTVYQYAKELGVPYIQECYFKLKRYRDPNTLIRVE